MTASGAAKEHGNGGERRFAFFLRTAVESGVDRIRLDDKLEEQRQLMAVTQRHCEPCGEPAPGHADSLS